MPYDYHGRMLPPDHLPSRVRYCRTSDTRFAGPDPVRRCCEMPPNNRSRDSKSRRVLAAELCAIFVAAVARLPPRMRLIVQGCAAGVRLVDLGQRLQQSPDAIRKARQRAFVTLRSVAVALAYEWAKKQR
jgi:hypothetical protein